MNQTRIKHIKWFQLNKLNLDTSKTRYMLFNSTTLDINLIKVNYEYIERVRGKGKEKSSKLVGKYVSGQKTKMG